MLNRKQNYINLQIAKLHHIDSYASFEMLYLSLFDTILKILNKTSMKQLIEMVSC